MKTVFKILGGFVAVIVLIVVAVTVFSSGSRDVAKQFVLLSSSGDTPGAHMLMHPALRDQLTADKFTEMFAGAEPYQKVTFTSASVASGKPTELEGTATTASGCMSTLKFEILGEQITSFDIQPLCRH
ncbi:hypothetical protein [Sagittula salina]|uniref:Uncharacterized protein n=1 Tax=Sagittula salina TaxID=2820268 RepID=A0A940S4E7_9RHOB|nr:hypothetical protein [Sagittula salina]MBP0483800.1 hypothetical protein [Sagittula salina]